MVSLDRKRYPLLRYHEFCFSKNGKPQGNRIWSLRLLKAGSTSWGSGAINSDRGCRNAEEPASVRSFARRKGSSAVNHLPDFSYAIALGTSVLEEPKTLTDDKVSQALRPLVSFQRHYPKLILFPLDGSRRLAGDVIGDPVDAADLVDDPGRDSPQEFMVEREIVGGHAVDRRDRP